MVFLLSPKSQSCLFQQRTGHWRHSQSIDRREALPQDDGTTITTLLKDVREVLMCHCTKQSRAVMNILTDCRQVNCQVNWGGLFLNPYFSKAVAEEEYHMVFKSHLALGEMRATNVTASLAGHSCREVKVPRLIEVWWYVGIWWCGSYRQLLVV